MRLADLTSDGLIVRETKFRKTRLLALHDSTRGALNRYLEIRKPECRFDDHLFILSTGKPLDKSTAGEVFFKLAYQTGLRGTRSEPGPTLHDLRHTFAVRSLEKAIATDSDCVNRHILALSTYLGHVNVSSTYWYLEATPTLLRQIAEAAENAQTRRSSR